MSSLNSRDASAFQKTLFDTLWWILISAFESKTSMRCYSEKTGPKYQICDKTVGFQTCFTKYDDSEFNFFIFPLSSIQLGLFEPNLNIIWFELYLN